jgi:hypothetical protein
LQEKKNEKKEKYFWHTICSGVAPTMGGFSVLP